MPNLIGRPAAGATERLARGGRRPPELAGAARTLDVERWRRLVAGAVDVGGPADGPAIVLLHGTRRTRAMWRPQIRGLAGPWRVISLDLPGHGALADVPFGIADASAFVAAVIDALAGGRALVVGQSLGGYVAMDLAAATPDRVTGLVLASATAEPRMVARRAPRTIGSYLFVAAAQRLLPGGELADNQVAGRASPAAGTPPADQPATNGWLFKGSTRALVGALRDTFIPRLAAYPGPTLIINGSDDTLFRRGERAFLHAAANGRLAVIDGAGHQVNEEVPGAFDAAVRRFAAEVHAPATRQAAHRAEIPAGSPAEVR